MKKEPEKKNNTMEMIRKKAWEGVKTVSVKVVRFSFWEMAFLAFLLRLLVTPPFGAALALAAGSLWLYRNFAAVKGSAKNALAYLIELSEEEQEEYEASLWFRGSGRDEIQAVIGELSNHKINTCDLVQQIEDFPLEDQWDALKKEVRSLQVLPQTTDTAFYITWALPFLPTSRSPSGMVTPSVPRRGRSTPDTGSSTLPLPGGPRSWTSIATTFGRKATSIPGATPGSAPVPGYPQPVQGQALAGYPAGMPGAPVQGYPQQTPQAPTGQGYPVQTGATAFQNGVAAAGSILPPQLFGDGQGSRVA